MGQPNPWTTLRSLDIDSMYTHARSPSVRRTAWFPSDDAKQVAAAATEESLNCRDAAAAVAFIGVRPQVIICASAPHRSLLVTTPPQMHQQSTWW